jgi:hypothetical protein
MGTLLGQKKKNGTRRKVDVAAIMEDPMKESLKPL